LKVLVMASLLSTVFNGLSYVIASLKSILHLVYCICLLHLTLCWLSSSTIFVALTLVVLIAPKSYLCKLTMTIYVPLGHLLLSVTIPYRESKPIVSLVNFRLTSKSVQLTPYYLCETHLKVGLAD
jgi:hypothetical protein